MSYHSAWSSRYADAPWYSAGSVIKSTSYYVQQLFVTNLGDQYLSSTLPTKNTTLQWSITRETSSGETFIKFCSSPALEQSLSPTLPTPDR